LSDKEDNKRQDDDAARKGMRWMGAGIEFCGVIAIFSYIGYKLDQHFGTSPLLLLTGFFVGFIGMLYLFYKESR